MQTQSLSLFKAPALKAERRGIPGFYRDDRVRWDAPQRPSHALTGRVIGFVQHCTKLVIRTADDHLLTLPPDAVTNMTREARRA